jgi:hypothetical protein
LLELLLIPIQRLQFGAPKYFSKLKQSRNLKKQVCIDYLGGSIKACATTAVAAAVAAGNEAFVVERADSELSEQEERLPN